MAPRLRLVVALSCVLGALAFAAAGGAGSLRALDRAATDRPDEAVGPQVHLVYAVPSDGSDAALDSNGTLGAWLAGFNDWLAQQSGGTRVRIDTFQGVADVSFLRLPQSTAELSSSTQTAYADVFHDLAAVQFVDLPKKVIVAMPVGAGDICGVGGGDLAVLFLSSCDGTSWVFVAGHELFHTLGAVAKCAPHYDGTGHVNDPSSDLMWPYTQAPGETPTLDQGHDDYWGPPGDNHIPAGCTNVADSDFLTSHPFFRLTVQPGDNGAVTRDLGEGEDDCTAEAPCADAVRGGTSVTLTAEADADFRFAGWSGGACSTETCTLSVTADTTVEASFVPLPELHVSVVGHGRVDAAGESCSAHCSVSVPYDEAFAVRATAAKGWRFVRWTGACTGTSPRCSASLEDDGAASATFAKLVPVCAAGKHSTAKHPCRRR
jgi:hypothetical protein